MYENAGMTTFTVCNVILLRRVHRPPPLSPSPRRPPIYFSVGDKVVIANCVDFA